MTQTKLSESELHQIRDEAEKYIVKVRLSTSSIDRIRDINLRKAYIAAVTAERERAKGIIEALEKIVKEAEFGIVHTSGKYIKSLAQNAINNYKNNKR